MTIDETKSTGLSRLCDPFLPEQISLLPKPTKKKEEMDKLPKGTCKVCGGYHATSNIIHLSYVGHAALTARLLEVDEAWNWEPLAIGPDGYPVMDKDGGMWIKLTVLGVTRLGYGDAQGKTGANATKERIGDALRNAAMRFGAALDLWHKGDSPLFEQGEPDSPDPKTQIKSDLGNDTANDKAATLCAEIDKCMNHETLIAWGKASKKQIEALPEVQKSKVYSYWKQIEAMILEVQANEKSAA